MKLTQIELFSVKVPLSSKQPGFFAQPNYFLPSWIPGFRQSEMRMYLLRLTTDSGHQGFSAMPAMNTERDGLGPLLGSYLLGINPLNLQLVNQRMQEFAYLGMRNGWIETAFWDLIGKIKGEPLYKLLGGPGGKVYPYASMGENKDHSPKVVRELIPQYQAEGYRGVKIRVKSRDLNKMVDYVAAAREAAGPDLKLMIDANQGWPVDLLDETPRWDVEFATQFAQAIEPYSIYWLEEPLNKGNFQGLATLRSATTNPIAGAEMNSGCPEFMGLLNAGSLDVYQPDPILVGGTYAGGVSVTQWLIREIQRRNREENAQLKFCPHTWTTGLGFAVALQLVGLLEPEERSLLEFPHEGHWNYGTWGRILATDLRPGQDGSIIIPDAPGLGVEVDMRVIRRFGKRVYNGTAGSVARYTLKDRGLKQALYLREKKEEQEKRWENVTFKIPEPPF